MESNWVRRFRRSLAILITGSLVLTAFALISLTHYTSQASKTFSKDVLLAERLGIAPNLRALDWDSSERNANAWSDYYAAWNSLPDSDRQVAIRTEAAALREGAITIPPTILGRILSANSDQDCHYPFTGGIEDDASPRILRSLAVLCCLASLHADSSGSDQEARKLLLAAAGIAKHLGQGPTLNSAHARSQAEEAVCQAACKVMPDQLELVAKALGEVPSIIQSLRGEAALSEARIQSMRFLPIPLESPPESMGKGVAQARALSYYVTAFSRLKDTTRSLEDDFRMLVENDQKTSERKRFLYSLPDNLQEAAALRHKSLQLRRGLMLFAESWRSGTPPKSSDFEVEANSMWTLRSKGLDKQGRYDDVALTIARPEARSRA